MAGALSLGHFPKGRWEFDESVVACFEDMLERSIPEYRSMRSAIREVAGNYIWPDAWIVDLGCSKGDALASLLPYIKNKNRLLAIDSSAPMVCAARERFAKEMHDHRVDVRHMDLREEYPDVSASLTLSVLTLQFIPIEHRQHIVAQVYRHTLPGGAFIFVEKILGQSSRMDKMFVANYHRLKRSNGYGQDVIDCKRRSLEGTLVPLTAQWNEILLKDAGFETVECFWRWMNFAGWVAVRGGA